MKVNRITIEVITDHPEIESKDCTTYKCSTTTSYDFAKEYLYSRLSGIEVMKGKSQIAISISDIESRTDEIDKILTNKESFVTWKKVPRLANGDFKNQRQSYVRLSKDIWNILYLDGCLGAVIRRFDDNPTVVSYKKHHIGLDHIHSEVKTSLLELLKSQREDTLFNTGIR